MIKIVQKIIKKAKSKIKAINKKYKIILNAIDTRDSLFDFLTYFFKRIKRVIMRFIKNKHKICYILRNVLESRFIYIIICALLMWKTLLFYDNVGINIDDYENILTFSIMFILVTLYPIWIIKKNKNRFYAAMILNVVISIVLFADCVYWKFAVNMLSVSQILYVKYAEEIANSIFYYLEQSQIYFFIDIPILIGIWAISRIPLIRKKTKTVKHNKGKRRIILAVICLIYLIRYTKEPLSFAFTEMIKNPYMKQLQVGTGSILGYHYLDIYNMFNMKDTTKYKTYDEIKEAYSILEAYSEENILEYEEFAGIAEGKNVIILQLESLQNFLIGRTINGMEITPNLNKFFEDNIEITNMISQSYSTTADSEYSVMTSLYPLENGQTFSMYNTHINNDIFYLYKNKRYHTSYMHGNIKEFWSRVNVYDRLKVDEKLYLYDFEDTSELVVGYLSDELLYKQAIEKIISYESPIFSFIVAASSHTPFDLNGIIDKENKISIDIGEYRETQFGLYLEAANYADYAFGIFIDELKKNELYDNTVIIVFGDHYGLAIDDEEMEQFIKEINPNYNYINSRINYMNVLCGMRIPGVKSMKIEEPVSKLDIKPTLLQISGIEDDFSLGKSIFSSKDYAYISNASIVTEKYYYEEDEWYDISTGESLNLENIDEEEKDKMEKLVQNMKLQLDISRSIVINDLLKR